MRDCSAVHTSENYNWFRTGAIKTTTHITAIGIYLLTSSLANSKKHFINQRTENQHLDNLLGMAQAASEHMKSLTSDQQIYRTEQWLLNESDAWKEGRYWLAVRYGIVLRLMSIEHLAMKILVETPSQVLYWSYESCANLRYLRINNKFNLKVLSNNAKIITTTTLILIESIAQDFLQILIPELVGKNPFIRVYNKLSIIRIHASVHHIPDSLLDMIQAVNTVIQDRGFKFNEKEICFEFYEKLQETILGPESNRFFNIDSHALLIEKIAQKSKDLLLSDTFNTLLKDHVTKKQGSSSETTELCVMVSTAATQARGITRQVLEFLQEASRQRREESNFIPPPRFEMPPLFDDILNFSFVSTMNAHNNTLENTKLAFGKCFFESLKKAKQLLIEEKHYEAEDIEGMMGTSYSAMINRAILHTLETSSLEDDYLKIDSQHFTANAWPDVFGPLIDAKGLYDTISSNPTHTQNLKTLLTCKELEEGSEADKKAIQPLFNKIVQTQLRINQKLFNSGSDSIRWVDAF